MSRICRVPKTTHILRLTPLPAAQQTSALATANSVYQVAMAAAGGKLQTDLAAANLAYVNTTSGTTEPQSLTGADYWQTTAPAAAQYTYALAVADAQAALQSALTGCTDPEDPSTLGLEPAYEIASADSFSAAVSAFAAAHPSSWATCEKTEAGDAAAWAETDAADWGQSSQTEIDAQQADAYAQALAAQTLTNAQALSAAVLASAQATAASALASVQAAAGNVAAAFGFYQATAPALRSLPTLDLQAVNAVMLQDYTTPATDGTYQSIVKGMLYPTLAEGAAAVGGAAIGYEYMQPLSASQTINPDLGRAQSSGTETPAAETKVVGNVLEYYNDLTGQYEALPSPLLLGEGQGQGTLAGDQGGAVAAAAGTSSLALGASVAAAPISGAADADMILCSTAFSGEGLVNVAFDVTTGHNVATASSNGAGGETGATGAAGEKGAVGVAGAIGSNNNGGIVVPSAQNGVGSVKVPKGPVLHLANGKIVPLPFFDANSLPLSGKSVFGPGLPNGSDGLPLLLGGNGPYASGNPSAGQPPLLIFGVVHLPAASRGTWIEGTAGNGVFQYAQTSRNIRAGVAGMKIRFVNNSIAIGAFPPEAYYLGSAEAASVPIESVTGGDEDFRAAREEMRLKLKDPHWQKPKGYIWNHAGGEDSTTMELVDQRHARVAHEGPAKGPRARLRAQLGAQGVVAGATNAFTVYIVLRDALQAAGILEADYVVLESDYYFLAPDKSVFVIQLPPNLWGIGGMIWNPERKYIAGPRKGESEEISWERLEQYRKEAEEVWGRLIPGYLIRQNRFIPDTMKDSTDFSSGARVGGVD